MRTVQSAVSKLSNYAEAFWQELPAIFD